MPRKDATGPLGQGSMTGRGLGPCKTNEMNTNNEFAGRGFGRRQGMGNRPRGGFGRFGNRWSQDTHQDETIEKLSHNIGSLTEEVKKLIDKFSSDRK